MAVNIGREKAECWGDYESTLADVRQKCLYKVLYDVIFYAGLPLGLKFLKLEACPWILFYLL